MSLKIIKQEVGPWPMNAYILIDETTQSSAIIDPGADAEQLLSAVLDTRVAAILVTHGHADHVGALDAVRSATEAPVYMNPIDARGFNLQFDQALDDGQLISIGEQQLRAGGVGVRQKKESVVHGAYLKKPPHYCGQGA